MKVFDFIVSLIFGGLLTISFLSPESIKSCEWIGIGVGIGTLIFICQIHKERIEELKKEIEELKNKKND